MSEQTEGTLEDTMLEIYNSQTAEQSVVDEQEPEVAQAEESEEVSEEVEDSSENSHEVEASNDEQEEETASDHIDEDIEIPEHWSKEDKERFANMPKEVKEFLVKREKQTSAAYYEKTRELAETKRTAYDIDKALEPYKQEFKLRGLNPVQAVEQLLAYSKSLQENPSGTLRHLAQMYGVDLNEQSSEEYDDPALRDLKGEIGGLKQMLANQESKAIALQQQQQALAAIERFKTERDGGGNPLRPYFDKVEGDMAQLISSGMAANLEEAYQKACRLRELNPKGRTSNNVATLPRKTAKEAKLAASGVKSSSVTPAEPSFKTMEEQMLHELKKMTGK